MPDTPLITEAEYESLYKPIDTSKFDLLAAMVSSAIRRTTGRDFGEEASGPSERSYAYDGSGYCDIDDAASITQVKVGTVTVPDTVWVAKPEPRPSEPEAYWWIENLPRAGELSSEMGFLQNWDTIGVPVNRRVYVTATWGWPSVPADVKMAAAMTINTWDEVPGAFVSESIEGYSRTVSLPSGLEDAIPSRAQMLLSTYDRGPVL